MQTLDNHRCQTRSLLITIKLFSNHWVLLFPNLEVPSKLKTMKTLLNLSFALALSFVLIVGSAFTVKHDTFTKKAAVSTLSTQSDIVISGCVGQCGFAYSGTYVVTDAGIHDFKFLATSDLCAALGAKALVRKNGNTVFLGDVENGADMDFIAKDGDVIQLDAELFIKQRVPCWPRGQVDMQVIQLN